MKQQDFTKFDSRAIELVNARVAGKAFNVYPGEMPRTLDEAYAIQDDGIRLYPDTIIGWKVGGISVEWEDKVRASRLVGPVFSKVEFQNTHQVRDMPVFKNGFAAIEGEVIAIIRQDAPIDKIHYTTNEAIELISAIHVGAEIASSPFPEINDHGPLVTITDFGNNRGLVLGEEISKWQTLDIENWVFRTYINSQLVGESAPDIVNGGPIESVRYLLENTAKRGLPLKAGMKILTGAITGVHQSNIGDLTEVRCNSHLPILTKLTALNTNVQTG